MKSENTSNSFPVTRAQAEALRLPYFSGFPYIWTRIVPSLYHIIVVPKLSEPQLRDIAIRQALANHLPTCLVLGDKACYYFDRTDGRENWDSFIPRGGHVIYGKMQPSVSIESDADLTGRQRFLVHYEKATNPGGYLVTTTDTRPATNGERIRLWGRRLDRVQRGLTRCSKCQERRGECLYPNPWFSGQVVRVYCLCENDNLCAACGKRLYERKLNAAFFNPRDRKIWNVPGFCGLDHTCPAARH